VFVAGDEVTGVLDWSQVGAGDALYGLATSTLGHEGHLGDVSAGYDTPSDLRRDRVVIVAKSAGGPLAVEHGFSHQDRMDGRPLA
jgi:hypothetical protein